MYGEWIKALEDIKDMGMEDVMNAAQVISLDGLKDRSYSMEDNIAEAMDFDDLWDSRSEMNAILEGWC